MRSIRALGIFKAGARKRHTGKRAGVRHFALGRGLRRSRGPLGRDLFGPTPAWRNLSWSIRCGSIAALSTRFRADAVACVWRLRHWLRRRLLSGYLILSPLALYRDRPGRSCFAQRQAAQQIRQSPQSRYFDLRGPGHCPGGDGILRHQLSHSARCRCHLIQRLEHAVYRIGCPLAPAAVLPARRHRALAKAGRNREEQASLSRRHGGLAEGTARIFPNSMLSRFRCCGFLSRALAP